MRSKKASTSRCAVYTRKSTARGLDMNFNSLDAQLEACQKYIERKADDGWKLLSKPYSDGGFTGANLDRPGFKQLMEDVEAGQIDIIVVYKVDRLSRSLLDFAKLMDRFDEYGVAFVSVTQNFSTADAMGRLTLNMLMSFAEFERSMIAERTRDKIAASKRKGLWTGGPPRFGYDVAEKKLVINKLEAVVVREMFDLYERYRSAAEVARLLNESGRRTKQTRTQAGVLRGGKRWQKGTVLRCLRDCVLTGYVPHGDELFEGRHKAIISREQFERVGALLSSSKRGSGQGARNPDYILQGVIRCALCKSAMSPASTRAKGTVYRYYKCITKAKKGKKACASSPLSADAIEEYVLEQIRGAIENEDFAAELHEALRERIEARRSSLTEERQGLTARVETVRKEIDGLMGELPKAEGKVAQALNERLSALIDGKESHQAQLDQVLRDLGQVAMTEVEADWVAERLENLDETWDVMRPVAKGRLITALVGSIEVDEPAGAVTIRLGELGTTQVEAA